MKLLIKIILVAWKAFTLITYCFSFERAALRPVEEYPSDGEAIIMCSFGISMEETAFMLFLFIGLPLALAFGALFFLSPANKPCVKTPATLKLN